MFYRQSTRQQAIELNLTGWVRNLDDGSVEILTSGTQENLNSLVEWCKVGPPSASVQDVQVEWRDSSESTEVDQVFRIR